MTELSNGDMVFDPFKTREWSDALNVSDLLDVRWSRLEPLQDIQPWNWDEFTSRYDGWLPSAAVEKWKQLCFLARDATKRPSWHPMHSNTQPSTAEETERALYALLLTHPPLPRVFVSYRSTDRRLANVLRSYLLNQGKRVWMDVWDPRLVAAAVLPPYVRSRLTAIIIEIALLSSTHLVIVHTANTASSLWVPYELGRAKHRLPAPHNAAFWHNSNRRPGYAYLVENFERVREAKQFAVWVSGI